MSELGDQMFKEWKKSERIIMGSPGYELGSLCNTLYYVVKSNREFLMPGFNQYFKSSPYRVFIDLEVGEIKYFSILFYTEENEVGKVLLDSTGNSLMMSGGPNRIKDAIKAVECILELAQEGDYNYEPQVQQRGSLEH